MDNQASCPYCHFLLTQPVYFCPNCGKKLKEPPLATTVGKQIQIYLVSLLLPPLGIIPSVKYMLQKDEKAKIIGLVALLLTIVSTIITIWLTIATINQVNTSLNSTLNQYKSVGL